MGKYAHLYIQFHRCNFIVKLQQQNRIDTNTFCYLSPFRYVKFDKASFSYITNYFVKFSDDIIPEVFRMRFSICYTNVNSS